MFRICYLILAHHMPRHLSRLVRTLHSENTTFFVHIDRKADIEVFRSALRSDNLRFVNNRVRVNSADFSCVQATINLIKEALSGITLHRITCVY